MSSYIHYGPMDADYTYRHGLADGLAAGRRKIESLQHRLLKAVCGAARIAADHNRLRDLLREVADSALEFESCTHGSHLVQIDPDLWERLQAEVKEESEK